MERREQMGKLRQRLLDAQADVYKRDIYGYSVLAHATKFGHVEIVKMVIASRLNLKVEQLVSGLDGEGVCQSVADYCLAQPNACTGDAVWQAALGAFGITTRTDKDKTSMLVLGWLFPRPMRPPLMDQQLFKLLCNKLMPVMHNWDNPIARVEHQDDVSDTDSERYDEAQWYWAMTDIRNRSSAVPNYEEAARKWHYSMLTLPGKILSGDGRAAPITCVRAFG